MHPTRRTLAGAAAASLGLVLAVTPLFASVASATPSGKITLCHATASVTNPYVAVTVDMSSVDEENNKFLNGHGDHTGPVFDPNGGKNQPVWGDIIPAFTNTSVPNGSSFPGYNLTPAGLAILAAGCAVPVPSTPPTGSTTPPASDPTSGSGSTTPPASDPTTPPASDPTSGSGSTTPPASDPTSGSGSTTPPASDPTSGSGSTTPPASDPTSGSGSTTPPASDPTTPPASDSTTPPASDPTSGSGSTTPPASDPTTPPASDPTVPATDPTTPAAAPSTPAGDPSTPVADPSTSTPKVAPSGTSSTPVDVTAPTASTTGTTTDPKAPVADPTTIPVTGGNPAPVPDLARLPKTGSEAGVLVPVGAGLVALGVIALVAGRRREDSTEA